MVYLVWKSGLQEAIHRHVTWQVLCTHVPLITCVRLESALVRDKSVKSWRLPRNKLVGNLR